MGSKYLKRRQGKRALSYLQPSEKKIKTGGKLLRDKNLLFCCCSAYTSPSTRAWEQAPECPRSILKTKN